MANQILHITKTTLKTNRAAYTNIIIVMVEEEAAAAEVGIVLMAGPLLENHFSTVSFNYLLEINQRKNNFTHKRLFSAKISSISKSMVFNLPESLDTIF